MPRGANISEDPRPRGTHISEDPRPRGTHISEDPGPRGTHISEDPGPGGTRGDSSQPELFITSSLCQNIFKTVARRPSFIIAG